MLIDKVKEVKIIENITVGNGKIFLIAGPCVIESEDLVMTVAEKMKEITDKLNIQYIYLRHPLIRQIDHQSVLLGDLDLKKGLKYFQG